MGVVGAYSATAQQPSRAPLGPPSDLRTAQAQHDAVIAAIQARFNERRQEALGAYLKSLGQVQQDATKSGDLDTALAAKAEIARLADPNAVPAKVLPKGILPHHRRYEESVGQARQVATRDSAAQIKRHLGILESLQVAITKTGDLDAAAEIKTKRESLTAELTALESGAAVTAAPAIEKMAATAPVPAPSGPTLNLPPSAIAVVTELKAKGGATGAAPGTIVFDAPPGNGRRGAKGILLNHAPTAALAARGGSTWVFHYTRGGSARGLQIIHPTAEGQAIVSLRPTEASLSTPKAWIEVGYGAGDVKRTRLTAAAKKFFPLQDGVEYLVVSRLSAKGEYDLYLNGELVATARASTAPPLDLTIPAGSKYPDAGSGQLEFKSSDPQVPLPLKWTAGWAGLIVGPMDNGQNVCRDARFYPGVAEIGGARR